MKLLRINVENLFDCYSYPINLVENRPITLIHAPNGYGKTTMLRLTKSAVDLDLFTLCEVPFSKFILSFSDKITIEIIKTRMERNSANYDMEFLLK